MKTIPDWIKVLLIGIVVLLSIAVIVAASLQEWVFLYAIYELSAPLALIITFVSLVLIYCYTRDTSHLLVEAQKSSTASEAAAAAAQQSAEATKTALAENTKMALRASILHMLNIWHSAEAIAYRRDAWAWLHELKRDRKNNEIIYIGQFRYTHSGDGEADEIKRCKYYSVSHVYHFIADVTVLVEKGAADKDLALALFKETFYGWLKLLADFSRARSEQDETDEGTDSPATVSWFYVQLKAAYPLFCPEYEINEKGMAQKKP